MLSRFAQSFLAPSSAAGAVHDGLRATTALGARWYHKNVRLWLLTVGWGGRGWSAAPGLAMGTAGSQAVQRRTIRAMTGRGRRAAAVPQNVALS